MKLLFSLAFVAISSVSATIKMCGQFQTYSKGDFIVNNNAWNQDNSGSICTFTDETGAPATRNIFSTIWQWSSTPMAVRAYPNIQYTSPDLPLQLNELIYSKVNASWTLGLAGLPDFVSSDPNSASGGTRISAAGAQTDVAFDIFLDEDKNTTMYSPNNCKYEVMIWLGRFGHNAKPIGHGMERYPPLTQIVSGIEFTLTNGTNANGQTVYTWLANNNITDISLDIAPLLQYLPRYGLMPFNAYLGPIHFGSETFYSQKNMNFTLREFAMEVQQGRTDESKYELPHGGWKNRSKDPENTQNSGRSLTVVRTSKLLMILTFVSALVYLV